MPRPKRKNVVVIQMKFWLIPGRDDDVICYLQTIPVGHRASAVIKAMRGGLMNEPKMPTEQEESNSILDALGDSWI
jgi:hypothetical protein